LDAGESAGLGAARLLRGLVGKGEGRWHPLGELRPNPGYSDERMTLGWLALEQGAGDGLASGALGDPPGGGSLQLLQCTPEALEARLSALEEAVDGRSVSAWFLASRRVILR
jgi:hypothetical protein